MSRPSSPAPALTSAASPNADHDEQSSRTEQSHHQQSTREQSREGSEAAPSNDDKSQSTSRQTSTSPSAVDPATASSSTSPGIPAPATASTGSWQAVWSPAHNAYYFYNSVTQETTWENPLETTNAEAGPSTAAASPEASTAATSSALDLYTAAAAQGIDPALAHLDPSLAAGPSAPGGAFTAKFNARTGAFARQDARDPSHLSEFERAKRMSEFYFDVNAWEKEVEMRKLQEAQEEESKKRKRPSKKDLERFKEQKRQKKLAKTAWLRT
ncbi:hypothetical protein BD413DRAFT_473847 [Trametes elegans]|nr:hypothetical protein BD413DRAFT_473847 [Trametes elegans]